MVRLAYTAATITGEASPRRSPRVWRQAVKITKIETFKYWIDWCNWLFVKVSTDEGLYGWGEGSLHGAIQSVETAVHEIGAGLIGKDPSGVGRHWQSMYHGWRWRGGPTLSSAMAALDIA